MVRDRSNHDTSETTDRSLRLGKFNDIRAPEKDDQATQGKTKQNEVEKQPRRDFTSLIFVMLYASLLLFTWSATCVISRRPIKYQSYDTSWASLGRWSCEIWSKYRGAPWPGCGGDNYFPISSSQIDANNKWRLVISGINFITAVLTIPVSSSICSHGAVAYTQRYGTAKFNTQKTLALADRGWWNPTILCQLLHPKGIRRLGTPYLLFCTVLCALGICSAAFSRYIC